ncbi:hypothetical protein [Paeniglutamicibacter sp. NPDC091659]|uniref:hypothetical protein n=1 Tax=Paeniglutamicibacter sp. NPDC091659 TaxID=3364389 RepID=UPI0038222642
MKRTLVTLAGSLGLVLAMSGCVPLDAPAPTPSVAPGLPAASTSTSVTAAIPDLDPYSTAGLEDRIDAMSKLSSARMLRAGKHPIGNAVPGTEKILIADTVSGEHYAAFPETIEGDSLSVSVLCQTRSRFSFEVYDKELGRQVGSGLGECWPQGIFQAILGNTGRSKPSYIRIAADDEVPLEFSVVAFESIDRPPN